jgi:hypothetical protein
MDVSPWVVMATLLGVLIYLSIPVALVLVYLSRVNAALGRKKAGKGSRGPDTDQTGGPAA